MSRYGIDWKKKDTHNMHLSVLDYKKKERAKEVDTLEEEIEGAQVVLELKEERIESLKKEIESKRDRFRKEQSETQKKLDDTIAENHKLQSETTDLRLKIRNYGWNIMRILISSQINRRKLRWRKKRHTNG